MDIALIRKVAAAELGRRALDELTATPDDSLDSVYLAKAAQAEDPDLFRTAMRMSGDSIGNYENLGGTFKKQAFGAPMFQVAAAPDPMAQAQASAAKPPAPAATGPKPPTPTSAGPQGAPSVARPGAGGPQAAGTTNPMQMPTTPKIPGATGQGAGSQ